MPSVDDRRAPSPAPTAEELKRHFEELLDYSNLFKPDDPMLEVLEHDSERLQWAATAAKMPPLVSVRELMSKPLTPPEYLVEEVFGAGEIVNLAGPYKLGKTWFALDLALAVSDEARAEFAGREVNNHGKVLYLNAENPEEVLHERLSAMGATADNPNLVFGNTFGGTLMLDNPEHSEVLRAWVKQHRPVLIVFDSLVRFHTLDENSATGMAKVYSEVAPLSRELGAAVLFLDHQARNGAKDPRGSGDKQAQVDRLWRLVGEPPTDQFEWQHGAPRRGITPEARVILRDHEDRPVRHVDTGGVHESKVREHASKQQSDLRDLVAQLRQEGSMNQSSIKQKLRWNNDKAQRLLKEAERLELVYVQPGPRNSKLYAINPDHRSAEDISAAA